MINIQMEGYLVVTREYEEKRRSQPWYLKKLQTWIRQICRNKLSKDEIKLLSIKSIREVANKKVRKDLLDIMIDNVELFDRLKGKKPQQQKEMLEKHYHKIPHYLWFSEILTFLDRYLVYSAYRPGRGVETLRAERKIQRAVERGLPCNTCRKMAKLWTVGTWEGRVRGFCSPACFFGAGF